jgi:bisphosphoglycerate-independent phosphoglycerate mutase (AlkP superfamily)
MSKYESKQTYKIIDGSIFTSDPWRIQALMLIMIGLIENVEIVSEPRKIMAMANGLAVAGLPHVIEMLKDGDDDPIWNLSECVEHLIKTIKTKKNHNISEA